MTENDIVVVSCNQNENWAMIPSPDRACGYECFFPHFFEPQALLEDMGLYMFLYSHCVEFSERMSDPQWGTFEPYRIGGIARDCGISIAKCMKILRSLHASNVILFTTVEKLKIFKLRCAQAYESRPRHKDRPRKIKPGYVYFLREEQTGTHKIGCTSSLKQRLTGIVLPCETVLVHSIESNDSRELERRIHEKYAPYRVNGEWFKLSPEHLEEIKTIGGEI